MPYIAEKTPFPSKYYYITSGVIMQGVRLKKAGVSKIGFVFPKISSEFEVGGS